MRDWRWLVGVCLAAAVPASAQTVDMGAKFHGIEAGATRVVTWFDDSYGVAERQADGRVTVRLHEVQSHRVLADAERGTTGSPGAEVVTAQLAGESLSLPVGRERGLGADWYSAQLRRLWREHAERRRLGQTRPPQLAWSRGSFGDAGRLKGVAPARLADPDEGVVSVATEFPGLVVIAQRDRYAQRPNKRAEYSTFTARVISTSTGKEVGFVRYFASARVITWKFPNGTSGVAPESRVPGGFGFTPSMAWANVQARAFLDQSLRRAGDDMLRPAASSWAAGLSMRPASLAAGGAGDECGPPDGCTGLHWLDGTVLEECCNQHDRCFADSGGACCTAWSWIFWNRIHCVNCNWQVVKCFATTLFDSREPDPVRSPCNDGNPCTRCMRVGWCPPECQICDGEW